MRRSLALPFNPPIPAYSTSGKIHGPNASEKNRERAFCEPVFGARLRRRPAGASQRFGLLRLAPLFPPTAALRASSILVLLLLLQVFDNIL